jgi:hypothetical protein
MSRRIRTIIIFAILMIMATLAACGAQDEGDEEIIQLIRGFHAAIADEDYQTAIVAYTCPGQECGLDCIGLAELVYMEKKFPWQDVELTRVKKVGQSPTRAVYALKLVSGGDTTTTELNLRQDDAGWCIDIQ